MIRTLGGRFDLLTLLGEGGMGAVWRARDRELDEVVALKLIKPELSAIGDMVHRFRSEVKLARRVTHRHVARIFEVGTLDGIAFFTMELVEGVSLGARLRRGGRLPWRDAVAIAAAVLDGLEAAHAVGVVHRDVKPDNILLEDGGRPVLTDFGIASARRSAAGLLAGTPAYMAPEQAQGEPPTPAADVYSVGVVLYEMLTGVAAFAGTPSEIFEAKRTREALEIALPDVEPALADVVHRATAREVAHRIRSATELRGQLARWVDPGHVQLRTGTRRRTDAAVKDIVITAPPPGGDDRRYLGDAFFENLVSRLWQSPGVRVVASWQSNAPSAPAARVTLAVDDALTVVARDVHDQEILRVRLPAAASIVSAGAAGVAAALLAALGVVDEERTAPELAPEVAELYLQARMKARRMGSKPIGEAVALFDRAIELAPEDGRIISARAMAMARKVFYDRADDISLKVAEEATREALSRCPDRGETLIAAGQVALHRGDVATAAQYLRRAIARAPHSAEAHEWLGRILLEAGHLEEGIARIETALSLDPNMELAHWEIARAYALEGDWRRFDLIARELIGQNRLSSTAWAARFASWRGDHDVARTILGGGGSRTGVQLGTDGTSAPSESGLPMEFLTLIARAYGGDWEGQKGALLAIAANPGQASARRSAMVAQLVAEAAAGLGDAQASVVALEHAMTHGFFDLHWLDKCPLLNDARAAGAYAHLRPTVVARSAKILEALYSDSPSHGATADTMVATPTRDGSGDYSRSEMTWR
ncbi:MAG TPA: protein kinase [Kofleriaceae bacterium]|nr:protein kinase [Kofleriaceae bacterium]